MERQTPRERRRSNAKYYDPERRKKSSTFIRQIKGWCDMCRKSSICPEFERRTKDGIKGACKNCEYIKQERKVLWRWRIGLIITFITFIGSTYAMYN